MLVDERDRLDPRRRRRVGDLLAVLVGACEKEDFAPVRLVVARDDVRRDPLVRVPHVRRAVRVVDRRRHVEALARRRRRRPLRRLRRRRRRDAGVGLRRRGGRGGAGGRRGELGGGEPQRAERRRVRRVGGALDEQLLRRQREVAANRARQRVRRLGGAHHRLDGGDDVRPAPRGGDDRAVGDRAQQRLVGLRGAGLVVAMRQIGSRPQHLERDEREAALLEALADVGDEAAFDRLRADEGERGRHGSIYRRQSRKSVRVSATTQTRRDHACARALHSARSFTPTARPTTPSRAAALRLATALNGASFTAACRR